MASGCVVGGGFGPAQPHTSAINGMIYNRGSRADFDRLAELGNPEWGWDNILAAYKAIEDNALGPTATRGAGGPLHVSRLRDADPICGKVGRGRFTSTVSPG